MKQKEHILQRYTIDGVITFCKLFDMEPIDYDLYFFKKIFDDPDISITYEVHEDNKEDRLFKYNGSKRILSCYKRSEINPEKFEVVNIYRIRFNNNDLVFKPVKMGEYYTVNDEKIDLFNLDLQDVVIQLDRLYNKNYKDLTIEEKNIIGSIYSNLILLKRKKGI